MVTETISSKNSDIVMDVRVISPKYFIIPDKPNKIISFKEDANGEYIIHNKRYNIDKEMDDNLDAKILVYEDRTNGWFLNYADKIKNEFNAGFVVLMICLSYLEGNQQLRDGKQSKKSSKIIKKALKRIFKINENNFRTLDLFIADIRNGLFHDGMVRKSAFINFNLPNALGIDEKKELVIVNPAIFLNVIKIDFQLYIEQLKNEKNRELRDNFKKFHKEIYDWV